jgi:hypothetical protein
LLTHTGKKDEAPKLLDKTEAERFKLSEEERNALTPALEKLCARIDEIE